MARSAASLRRCGAVRAVQQMGSAMQSRVMCLSYDEATRLCRSPEGPAELSLLTHGATSIKLSQVTGAMVGGGM